MIFKPLIAFTRGLKYEVLLADKSLTEFEIALNANPEAPEIVSVYPTPDTVAGEFIKDLYRVFKTHAGRTGIEKYSVIKDDRDTIPASIFLDLDQELWNKERTMLTLWLDPGRIKRDLQPNQKLGSPLQKVPVINW